MFHGYDAVPAIASAGAYSVSPTPLPVEEIVADIEKAHADRFRELADFRGVEAAHTHLRSGPPAETLPLLARELGAGLVVMGAISRSRLQQAIIGSTAERVLDHLHCDVLVVKPEGFESEVSYKPQGRGFQELRATG
jgi:nucleotide-binding universal stress UspA family protein